MSTCLDKRNRGAQVDGTASVRSSKFRAAEKEQENSAGSLPRCFWYLPVSDHIIQSSFQATLGLYWLQVSGPKPFWAHHLA